MFVTFSVGGLIASLAAASLVGSVVGTYAINKAVTRTRAYRDKFVAFVEEAKRKADAERAADAAKIEVASTPKKPRK